MLETISRSCSELEKALQGQVMFSKDIDTMHKSLMKNQVPEIWAKVAYLSEKSLGSWISDLAQRIEFFKLWNVRGDMRTYLISAFFSPQVLFFNNQL